MNLYKIFNIEQIELLKEADVVVENRDYTTEERRYITNQVIGYIMNFSKKDISAIACKYESVLDKIKS